MKPVEALRRPLQEDLGGFVALLRRLQVPHRVSEERGSQVLWVPAEPLAAQVRELYLRYPHGAAEEELPSPALPQRPGFAAQLRASWMTSLVLLLTLAVTLLSQFGDNHAVTHWITFVDYQVRGEYAYFVPWLDSLRAGEWWRLFSPMLLHLNWLHLAMNGLWYWELGRRIEYRQGRLGLIGLTLLFGLLSNLAQFWFGGSGRFGGLSGVLYGLLGYCWIFQLLAPTPAYVLPRGVLGMMLIWLVVCLSGVIDTLGFGSIANAAHVGGLVAGCAAGLIGGALARARR
ncbi:MULTISPECIES: rhomboid family intramembrane serine protease [unclassified Pseudomonas]|uniref:rhomboid family intramembrane serine protease n=1 Tax=unclassified Pseudomonas TaxID=196821 RepID=UPI002448FE92|nr:MULTISPECIES: rhomboid family intramembrane serine protease [unclassified Pseudomonas]MDG9930084.1 rhomboid family intramembrane serine protease [Pseudomonas sp. GD04042]MDH0483514.1 rhomboid family intramembrane serine protease [Pseudomonas sp. GD04015]MDH0605510.1 rhomboid family intramembrane serine protease [Pseudomonas sp. GD03869]